MKKSQNEHYIIWDTAGWYHQPLWVTITKIFSVVLDGLLTMTHYMSQTNKLQVININYCVRGGHKPARSPWPTSRLTEMEK